MLESNPDKINWEILSTNINAIHLLESNPDKINWHYLSKNTNAIHLLEANQDKINWQAISANSGALKILERNQNMIDWLFLSINHNICTYDYDKMNEQCLIYKEELIKNRFHPRNLNKFRDWKIDGFYEDSDDDVDTYY